MRVDRLWRNLAAFFVGLLVSAVVMVPFASGETIAATPSSSPAGQSWHWNVNGLTAATCPGILGVYAANGGHCHYGNSMSADVHNSAHSTQGGYQAIRTWSCSSGTLTVVANGADPATADPWTGTCGVAGAYVCPANQGWTLSGTNCTRADCAAGQTRDSVGACVLACTQSANEQVGSGRYGFTYPQPSGVNYCVNGCTVYPGGAGTVVGAVKYQYAYVNGAGGAASSCSSTTMNTTPNVDAPDGTHLTDTTANSCISSGQGFGKVNGTVVCTGPVDTITTAKTVDVAKDAANATTTTSTTSETTCIHGTCTTTTTTNVTPPSGSGTTTGDTKTQDPAKFCADNPTSPLCKKAEEIDPGSAASVSGLYTKGSRTVADVLGDFKSKAQGAAFYGAAVNYFGGSLPSGSCTGMSYQTTFMGRAFNFDASNVLCGSTAASIYTILGLGVMLAAGWVAFRIAIL